MFGAGSLLTIESKAALNTAGQTPSGDLTSDSLG